MTTEPNRLSQTAYPTYENYKDSGVDWLGEIPEGWQVIKLKYVLDERNERTKTGDEPLFMVSQKYGLVVRADYHDKATVAFSSIDNKIVHKNDLVFNKLKAHLGVFYKSEIDFKGIVSPDYAVYQSKNHIEDLKLLELLFKLPVYIQQFIIRATGVAEGLIRLYTSELFDLPIPVPPNNEQKKILDFLSKKNVQIDQAIHLKQQQIAKLEEYKQIVIQNAVTKGLNLNVPMKDSGIEWIGKIPEHWEVKKLKYIVKLQSGDAFNSDDFKQTGFKVYGGNGFRGYSKNYNNDGNYILIGRQGALCGNVNYASGKFYATEHAIVVYPIVQIDTIYLGESIKGANFNRLSTSAAQPGISVQVIREIFFPYPSIEEQLKIGMFISQKENEGIKALIILNSQIDRLKEYKTILINQAVTGKIKVS